MPWHEWFFPYINSLDCLHFMSGWCRRGRIFSQNLRGNKVKKLSIILEGKQIQIHEVVGKICSSVRLDGEWEGIFPPLARVIPITSGGNYIPGGDAIALGTANKQWRGTITCYDTLRKMENEHYMRHQINARKIVKPIRSYIQYSKQSYAYILVFIFFSLIRHSLEMVAKMRCK